MWVCNSYYIYFNSYTHMELEESLKLELFKR